MNPVDIWNAVIEKASVRTVGTLSQTEATIYHVNRFICDFTNGGFSEFLYNISPNWAEITILEKEVRRLGCLEVAGFLAEAAVIFARPAASLVSGETWSVFLKRVDSEGAIEAIDRKLSGTDGLLWDHLERFTQAHYETEG